MNEQAEKVWQELACRVGKLAGDEPPLPFEPESVESARARFPKALADVFDPAKVLEGKCKIPAKNRANVFDFDDGIRMMASVDDLGTRTIIHVSGSFTDEGVEDLMKRTNGDAEAVVALAKEMLEQKFESFAPGLNLKHICTTPIGAFHFVAEEK